MRALAKARHQLGQFGRQQIAGVHRDHLPELHRRTAQVGQTLDDLGDVAGSQHDVAEPRALAVGKAADTLRHHAPGDTGSKAAELAEARQAPAGYGARPPIVIVVQGLTILGFAARP